MNANEAEALAMRYRDALVRLDEVHTMLVRTIQYNRIAWDEHTTEESVLSSFNTLAKQMYDAIPSEIRGTK